MHGIVDDQVHIELGRHLLFDPSQETKELLVSVPGFALSDHQTGGHGQGGKQSGVAVTDGVVGDTLDVAQAHGLLQLYGRHLSLFTKRSIPFNISVALASEIDQNAKNDLAASPDAKQALPIAIKVNVENKSDWREFAIIDLVWVAYGYRMGSPVKVRENRSQE